MHEGVVTCANHGYAALPASLDMALAIADREIAGVPEDKMLLIEDAWLRDLPEVPENFEPHAFDGPESLLRIVLTSGTTGQSKAVAFSVNRIFTAGMASPMLWTRDAPEVSMLDLSTGMGIWYGVSKLFGGGTFYHETNPKAMIPLLHAHKIEHISASPVQLAFLARELQQSSLRLSALKMVTYVGAQLSPGLLHAIRATLCPSVACLYGSTEAGFAAMGLTHGPGFGPGSVGYVPPGAQVEIVDDQGQPLPYGEEGKIRVRSELMVQEYLGDPDATAKYFCDGWFYSGDRGRLSAQGMLTLTGRESEVINRGGAKIDPATVDQQLIDQAGILDAAAFAYQNSQGVQDLAAAIVADEATDLEQLTQSLRPKLGTLCPSVFVRVAGIPRNEMGKPLRRELQEQYAQTLREGQ